MGFRAQFDGGKCGRCDRLIMKDDRVEFNSANDLEHMDCVGEATAPEMTNKPVEWQTAESLQRQALEDLELAQVAPIGRQGVCPVCRLELPLSRICDDHGLVRSR
jgi:hypothetical protein